MALLVQKLWRKRICQHPFFCPLSRGGGAKDLSGLSTKKIPFFLRLPLQDQEILMQVQNKKLSHIVEVSPIPYKDYSNNCKNSVCFDSVEKSIRSDIFPQKITTNNFFFFFPHVSYKDKVCTLHIQ